MRKGYLIGLSLQTWLAAKSSAIAAATRALLKAPIVAKSMPARRAIMACSQ
jgi:hypothetical protein